MRRLFRWLGIAILTVIFLALSLLGTAYFYKKDILQAVDDELKKNINGDVALGGLTFSLWDETPGLSITLHDIHVRGPYYALYHRDFFRATKTVVSVRLLPLLRKTLEVRSIHVSGGSLFIFRTHEGRSNTEVLKPRPKDDTVRNEDPMLVLLHRLRLEDIQVTYQDSLKRKSIGVNLIDLKCRIDQSDSSSRFVITGPLKFNGLMLNANNGSFLKDKVATVQWNLEFAPATKRLTIHPSPMQFARSAITLDGAFDFTTPGNMLLNVSSDKLDFEEGLSLLTQALQSKLSKIKIDKPIAIKTMVKGQLNNPMPDVDVSFQITKASLEAFRIQSEKATTTGLFSNHVDPAKPAGDRNSRVKLENFEGSFQGLKTKLTATLDDLVDPHILINSGLDVSLSDFNTFVDPGQFKITGGRFISSLEYSGMLNEFLDTTKTKVNGKLKGTAIVKEGAFRYVPRGQTYEKVNVIAHFSEHHVVIDEASLIVNKSMIKVKGELLGFVPFFTLPDEKGSAMLDIYSPSLNLESLLLKESPPPGSVKTSLVKKPSTSELIDRLSQRVQFELNVKLDRLNYQNMRSTDVTGNFRFRNHALEAPNVGMNLADGRIYLSMSLDNLDKPLYFLWIKSSVRQADIKKLFYSFNNFKLTTITHENLEGKVDVRSVIRSQVDDEFNLIVPTLNGDLDLVLKNGKLLNFEPLENMSNFLLKKRDFSNVQFGEIRTHITVLGKEFDIRRMEIESTILRLFVEGRYSLTGHTDMEVQVPLSNLKKRDKDYKPENVGLDQKVGPSVYLHVHNDEKGNTVIAYDPFKRHTKKSQAKVNPSAKSKKK